MGIRKYKTEEERKAAQRETTRRWKAAHPDYDVEWRAAHPDYMPEYYQANKEKFAEYYQANKEKIAEYQAEYRKKNKEKLTAQKTKYSAAYRKTPKGRASQLASSYRTEDKKRNRGECTLTADWILEHIFTQPCAHCGRTGWKIIGCNRLDNSLPHTPENVEPCCWKCNSLLDKKERSKPVYQYTKDGDLVKVWESTLECGKNGFTQCHIADCCNKKHKTHKGYIWSYEPLIIKVNNTSSVKIR